MPGITRNFPSALHVFAHVSKFSPSVCARDANAIYLGQALVWCLHFLCSCADHFWPSWGEGEESRPWSRSADGPWSASLEMDLTHLLTVSGVNQISPPLKRRRTYGHCICSSRCIATCMIMHLRIYMYLHISYIADFSQIFVRSG